MRVKIEGMKWIIILLMLCCLGLSCEDGPPLPPPAPSPSAFPTYDIADCPSRCGLMADCEQARVCLEVDPGLDGDGDGVPCERICR